MEAREHIAQLMERSRRAQAAINGYTQEEVDRIVRACGRAIYDNAETLAREAVEEGKLGNVPSKIAKMKGGMTTAYEFLRGKKSVGIISVEADKRIFNIAKPMGVVACITPSTNPTSTVGGNGMYALKCRDSIIFAPHPRTKKCTIHAVQLVREALKREGAPEDLCLVIEEPSLELTQTLMGMADVVVATGGPGMIKAAYSSGRPSYGVGPGNVQMLVDRGCRGEYEQIAADTVASRIRDNGLPCTCEQFVTVPKEDRDAFLQAMEKAGAYVVTDKETADIIREGLFTVTAKGDRAFNVENVGRPAEEIAQNVGITIPRGTKVILVEAQGIAHADLLCREKLCPVQAFYTYETFEEGMAQIIANLEMEGAGHSAVIYSHDDKHIQTAGLELPVSRVIVNAAGGTAGGNTLRNGLTPTLSLGCGSWGNNSISENLSYTHLMNITKVAYRMEDALELTDEEIWSD